MKVKLPIKNSTSASLKTRYAWASRKQLAEALADAKVGEIAPVIPLPIESDVFEPILKDPKLNKKQKSHQLFLKIVDALKKKDDIFYPTYDKRGNLTLVGSAKKETDLEKYNLPKDATMQDYFTAWWESFAKKTIKICRDIKKANSNN